MKKILKIRYIIALSIIIILMLNVKVTIFDKNMNIKLKYNSSAQKVEREYQGLIVNADELVLSIDGQIPSEADMKNNTVHLQQCIDSVSDAGGGKVVIPAGIFYFRQADEIGRTGVSYYIIKCKDNVIIEGAGTDEATGTILKPYAPENDLPVDMFFFNEIAVSGNATFLKNADYRNFVIDGAEAYSSIYTSAGKGFMINLFEDCDWDNVVVKNTDGTGFGVDCPINSTIKNCKAENCGKGGRNLLDKAPGASGFGIGTGYSDDESFLISNCESIDNLKFGYFFEHQSRFSNPQKNVYKATKSKGFVVQNCISSGNMYDFGGARANDVTYENCISNKKTTTRKSINFENISRRVHMVNCKVNNTFTDVEHTSGYYDAIDWAVSNGITEGISSNEFGISNECQRYQVIIFLYRMAGRPGSVAFYSGFKGNPVSVNGEIENAFNTGYSDLPKTYVTNTTEEACLEAIKWAQDVGILEIPSTEIPFELYNGCTMSQLFTWIYAYVLDGEGEITEENAQHWVVENGILEGIDNEGDILNRICTREEVVSILYNLSRINNTYSITYNLMGGTVQHQDLIEYTSGVDSFRLSIPTKYGYTFEGWTGSTCSEYIEENYKPQVDAGIAINDVGDKTFTANWIANNYTVSFDANGGEGTMENQYFMYDDVPQALLENSFTRAGYVFAGWKDENGKLYIDSNNDGLIPVRNLTTEQNGNIKLYAQWTALSIQYKVEHYNENVDGTYPTIATKTETLSANSGTSVTPEVKEYEGFTSPEKQTVEVAGDGSTVVKYYYTRNSYRVTVEKGKGIESLTGEGTYKYEQQVTLSAQLKNGYENAQWSSETTFTMPSEDVNLSVTAKPITYTITYNLDGGNVNVNPETYTVETENIRLNQPTKEHHEFIGWTGSNGSTAEKEVVIEKGSIGNKEYTANWEHLNATYKVEHYRQDLNGEYPETLKETETLSANSGTSVTPGVKTYEGFSSPTTQTVQVAGDGSTVEKYYYTRNSYILTVKKGEGIDSVDKKETYKFEERVILKVTLQKGYKDIKWDTDIDLGKDTETKKYDDYTSIFAFAMPANNKVEISISAIPQSNIITSTTQIIDQENLVIRKIKPKTTAEEIKKNLYCEMEFEIIDLKGNIVADTSIIGTGYKIKTVDGKEYAIIIWGDFTGDGKISIAELARASRIAVQQNATEKEKLIIDVSCDGKIKTNDLAAISRLAL